MGKVDPRVRLLAIILFSSLALYFQSLFWMFALCCFTLLFVLILGADFKGLVFKYIYFIPFICGITIVQILFIRSGQPLVEIFDFVLVYSDGLNRGIVMAMRFLILLCSAAIMIGEDNRRLIASLERMHVPMTFSMMLMLTLRFIPFFSESFKESVMAIQLRGIEMNKIQNSKKMKLYGHLLLPVLSDAIIKSQEMSIVMEARGFGALNKRSSYIELNICLKDYAIMMFLLIVSIGMVWLYQIG